MANINQYNRIKTINVEERVADVAAGSGTYREILDKVMANEIIPIVDGSGMIVGISYDSKVTNLIEDNIAQVAFEKRYRGINVMNYVLSALELKANNADIADVQEDAQGIRVVLTSGEVVTIVERPTPAPTSNCCGEHAALPEEVELTADDLNLGCVEDATIADVKKYLRDTYDHYLSGQHEDPDINAEDNVLKVSNIHWGRKR